MMTQGEKISLGRYPAKQKPAFKFVPEYVVTHGKNN
jgi:hypothetical protein